MNNDLYNTVIIIAKKSNNNMMRRIATDGDARQFLSCHARLRILPAALTTVIFFTVHYSKVIPRQDSIRMPRGIICDFGLR